MDIDAPETTDRDSPDSEGNQASRFLHHLAALVAAGVRMNVGVKGTSTAVVDRIRDIARQVDQGVPLDLVRGLSPPIRHAIDDLSAGQPSQAVLQRLGPNNHVTLASPVVRTLAYQALGVVGLATALFLFHCAYVVPSLVSLYQVSLGREVPTVLLIMDHVGRHAGVYSIIALLVGGLIARGLRNHSLKRRSGASRPMASSSSTASPWGEDALAEADVWGSGNDDVDEPTALQSAIGGDGAVGSLATKTVKGVSDLGDQRVIDWLQRQAAVRRGVRQIAWSLFFLVGVSGATVLVYGMALFGTMAQLLRDISGAVQ